MKTSFRSKVAKVIKQKGLLVEISKVSKYKGWTTVYLKNASAGDVRKIAYALDAYPQIPMRAVSKKIRRRKRI